jgi:predicted aspartyl protease
MGLSTKSLNRISIALFIALSAALLLLPPTLRGEFYEYIDKNGVKIFTDDSSLIPDIQQDKTKIHKERYDHLDEEQKNELILHEQEEIDKQKKKTRASLEKFEQQEKIERQQQEDIKRQKYLEALNTPITISQNKILVPVTIGYANREITRVLLLDTGASITSVNQSVAEQLNINTGKSSAVMVAGGGILKTKLVDVKYIKVGPKTLKNPRIMVLEQKGAPLSFHGLLGQNFLSRFHFTIDYANSLIRWKE